MSRRADWTSNSIHILVLAGGSGTRLWPLSSESRPKQFLSLCGNTLSLLQLTVRRMLSLVDKENLHVLSGKKWKQLVDEQLEVFDFGRSTVIEEPEARSTAPAIALGIAHLLHHGVCEDAVVIVCPSDHLIKDERAFANAIGTAIKATANGKIVTLGIKPLHPETGFGYVKTQGALKNQKGWLDVDSFVEKPNRDTATKYLETGDYYWNGGIFCFRIVDIIEAFGFFSKQCHEIVSINPESLEKAFLCADKISIDYEVMEKAKNIVCVPLDVGWSDVGSWNAVYENSPKDENGNAVVGNVILNNCTNCLVVCENSELRCSDLDSAAIICANGDMLVLNAMGDR